jgi:transposase
MIQLGPQMTIMLAIAPIDFRKGVDGLKAVCRNQLEQDPFSGTLFIFRNRAATSIKILMFDGQGFWLCMKRLSKGRMHWWPAYKGEPLTQLAAKELHVLLYNGNPKSAQLAEDWRR